MTARVRAMNNRQTSSSRQDNSNSNRNNSNLMMIEEKRRRKNLKMASYTSEMIRLYATYGYGSGRRGRVKAIVLMLPLIMLNITHQVSTLESTSYYQTTTAMLDGNSRTAVDTQEVPIILQQGPAATTLRLQQQPPPNTPQDSSSESSFHPQKIDLNSAIQQQQQTTTSLEQPLNTTSSLVVSSPQVSQATTKAAASVLRPSLEEVASKLSRKHLNLEHENWRLRTTPGQVQQLQEQVQFDADRAELGGAGVAAAELLASTYGGDTFSTNRPQVVEAEQDIREVSSSSSAAAHNNNSGSRNNSSVAAPQVPSSVFKKSSDHYLHIDAASGAASGQADSSQARQRQRQQQQQVRPSSPSAAAAASAAATSGSSRRKKGGTVFQQSYFEDNELFQCHQYLQFHSSPQALSPSPMMINAGLSRLVSNQLLPCSCESRQGQHDDPVEPSGPTGGGGGSESTWLSCDNVQLMGSHFYAPPANDLGGGNNATGARDGYKSAQPSSSLVVTRFSQRDSGLQTLHAQKFHYLQLYHLRNIDLSHNRIRQIKMDAFHGLEMKLEYLDLANNLLGDSRALSNDRLIFSSDELNRLRKLKWLSLHNNQINQLSPTIFYKLPTTDSGASAASASASAASQSSASASASATTNALNNDGLSELYFLDLSENLLSSLPSESIYLLNELTTLKLNRNKLTQLDQTSKFPRSLRYLDLSENLIRTIRQCNLIDLAHLTELNLSHNQLSQLDKTAFMSSASSLANNLMLASDISSSHHELASSVPNHHNGQPQASVVAADSTTGQLDELGEKRSKRQVVAGAGGDEFDEMEDAVGVESSVSQMMNQEQEEDDLEASESMGQYMRTGRQTMQDESNFIKHLDQFNSTLRLNLSHNLFENVPGDSLLKFTNLQQIDLSYNRIRKLDANYFCSIYSLVESLRQLDLSGNLLSPHQPLNQQQQQQQVNGSSSEARGGRYLNKLFGCLLRLEKLSLSTNRLAALETPQPKVAATQPPDDLLPSLAASQQQTDLDYVDQMNSADSNTVEQFADAPMGPDHDSRLIIKFGESFGSRYLNTLDLSDNQLSQMPIIEQVTTNPIVSMNVTSYSNVSDHQSNLNQWMSSRMYLEFLYLNYNSIERLEERDFEHLFNLRHLSLDFNKLSALPLKLMRRFTSLDRLSLSGNLISSLSPLNELLERSSKTLRYLNLSNNRLTEWPQITSGRYSPSHHYQQQQMQMQQEYHHHEEQALGFSLEELDLEGNQLSSDNVTSLFDQLLYMKSLRVLNLKFNHLTRVRSEWFKFANKNLQTLLLAGNRINNIDLGSFAYNQVNEMLHLDLEYNLLRELKRKTFDSLPRLRELNLANNLIHTINSETFHQVSSLQVLKLNNNKLTSWKCEYFSNLCNPTSGAINAELAALLGHQQSRQTVASDQQTSHIASTVSALVELDLSHNSLSQLRANSIAVHTKLVRLNLSHNKLSFIPHDLFKATTSGLITGRQVLLVSSIKYLNLAHNHIQTIDNINFRPLKNLLSLDLSFNELQTLGVDVVLMDPKSIQQEQNNRRIIISNNLTNLPMDDEVFSHQSSHIKNNNSSNRTSERQSRSSKQQQFLPPATNWPALSKLRHLNVANNQLTLVNQSLISELSPFALLNLDLSFNYLESESLPYGFYSKITASPHHHNKPQVAVNNQQQQQQQQTDSKQQVANYDLVFTLKLESLDLSHNKLSDFPANLLDNHYTSMESCNLSHNRIQNLVANTNLMLQIKSLNLEFNPLNRESNELVLFEQKSVRYLNLATTRLYAIQQATDQLALDSASAHLKYRMVNQTSQLDLIRSISKPINAPYLRHLNLSSNQLVWLAANAFDKMHSLQTLDLSNNQLTRLHLLNNQLMHVSSSLEYLNMASNLFTSIDSNDFSQMSKLRHLDLSNLLSLQKMNCKFISRLRSLRTLKLFNYPQLRQNINNLLLTISSLSSQDRLQRKLMNELVMSSIGEHCFHDPMALDSGGYGSTHPAEAANHAAAEAGAGTWFDLEHVELELFNNFWNKQHLAGGGFKLRNELSQLLGPHLRQLTLYGLNLTSLSDDSLFGITSEQLALKISYTSMTQLPLRQLLMSLVKRTRLNLDFRNNNIQSVDTRSLQLLDELQSNHQIMQRGDHSSLRLAANPIRCDCQTRPLWLWLNQRWANPMDQPTGPAAATGEDLALPVSDSITPLGSSQPSYLPRFKGITYTSDLRCHYPIKLRGKPTQHVNYNELICKGPAQPILVSSRQTVPAGSGSNKRQRNDTRPSDSYYITSSASSSSSSSSSSAAGDSGGGGGDQDELMAGAEDDYLDFAESRYPEATVKVTKFNRFPVAFENNSSQLWRGIPVVHERPSSGDDAAFPVQADLGEDESWNRKERRGNRGLSERGGGSTLLKTEESGMEYKLEVGSQQVGGSYNKHRPNMHQRHSHYGDTVGQLNTGTRTQHLRAAAGAGGQSTGADGHHQQAGVMGRSTLLTDMDVLILTVSTIAMIIMSFIIIIICLYKHKLDQEGKEQILETQNKFLASQAAGMLLSNSQHMKQQLQAANLADTCGLIHIAPPPLAHSKSNPTSSQSSSNSNSNKSSSQSSKKFKPTDQAGQKQAAIKSKKFINRQMNSLIEQSALHHHHHQQQLQQQQRLHNTQVLLPAGAASSTHLPASNDNFLMRSPTIRRMQGFATNASDWFKFTLRAYPQPALATRRRHLLTAGKNPLTGPGGSSQLTTARLLPASGHNFDKLPPPSLLPAPLATGCPVHAFRGIQRGSGGEQCEHCRRLVAAMRRHKVQYVVGAPEEIRGSSATTTTASNSSASQAENGMQNNKAELGGGLHHNHHQQQHQKSSGANAKVVMDETGYCQDVVVVDDGDNVVVAGGGDEVKMRSTTAQREDSTMMKMMKAAQQQSASNQQRLRDQQQRNNRPLRTFGGSTSANANPPTATSMASKFELETSNSGSRLSTSGGQLRSQIPTVDIEGRFTYQSDSTFDCSPLTMSQSQQSSRPQTRQELDDGGSEHHHNHHQTPGGDTFIHLANGGVLRLNQGHHQFHRLVGSGENEATLDSSVASSTNFLNLDQLNLITNNKERRENLMSEMSSLMNEDECSHSSSPVAYGFMRSSPSATTLSSVTTAHTQQHQQLQNHNQHQANPNVYLPTASSSSGTNVVFNNEHHHLPTTSMNDKNHNIVINNNNSTSGHWLPRREAAQSTIASSTTTTTNNDEQIIISRL